MKSIENLTKEYLYVKETVIWTGKPKMGIVFNKMDRILIPLGIYTMIFCAIFSVLSIDNLLFAISVSKRFPTEFLIPIFVIIPFFITGIYMLFGRKIAKIFVKKHITYIITDLRVIIVKDAIRTKYKSIEKSNIEKVVILEKKNGYGNIYINLEPFRFKTIYELMLEVPWLYFLSNKFILFDIAEAQKVRDILAGFMEKSAQNNGA